MAERIAKLLARRGIASRRAAEEIVRAGRVQLDGKVLTTPAQNVEPTQEVLLDGKPLPAAERARLFCFHKARGLVCTHADPQGRTSIYDVLRLDVAGLQSVGRLDINSEGLLLLTNHGGLKRYLELPSTGLARVYRARAFGGRLNAPAFARLKKGITIDGIRYAPIQAKIERRQARTTWLNLTLHEGKNREVRRVLEYLGAEVSRLIRISYGAFHLGKLQQGKTQEVSPQALAKVWTETN